MALGAHFNDLLFVELFGYRCFSVGWGNGSSRNKTLNITKSRHNNKTYNVIVPCYFFLVRFPFGFHTPRKYLARSSLIFVVQLYKINSNYTRSVTFVLRRYFLRFIFTSHFARMASVWPMHGFCFAKLFIWMFPECSTLKVETYYECISACAHCSHQINQKTHYTHTQTHIQTKHSN